MIFAVPRASVEIILSGKRARARYTESFGAQYERLCETLGRLAIPLLAIATGDDVAEALRRGGSVEALGKAHLASRA